MPWTNAYDATIRPVDRVVLFCHKKRSSLHARMFRSALSGFHLFLTLDRHIFCIACSKNAGLTDAPRTQRRCPVCATTLPNIDDAVQTRLNPSEEYKASVLSGLDPSTIMECAGRAIAFWTYQITQEFSYQEYVAKNLSESNDHLNTAVDKIIHDANTEIQALEKKFEALSVDHKTLEHKYAELVDLYREKSRKHSQTQKLYDTLKKKCLVEQTHGLVSNNPAQIHKPVNTIPQPASARTRADQNQGPPQRPRLNERPGSRGGQIHHGPEQLHPHQRSGSSAYGGDQVGMLPPERSRLAKTRLYFSFKYNRLLLTDRSEHAGPGHSSAQNSLAKSELGKHESHLYPHSNFTNTVPAPTRSARLSSPPATLSK
ncbi:hypothetical protein A1O1_02685 [Capronia coronata CBS 617.96]|uniref:Cyclin B1 interacting protein 1 n=1 Tax=Capronia coronata CBS 617.96 TaxID=1182541 RepID=W9YYC5_9EURO|nr:uncharacterized protein A1O1_02685 [Capronia coronata CBS 617.96]EXJ94291.1 hypothetical protein A1O1_02685 [Capronia coronata CBS 617.96]